MSKRKCVNCGKDPAEGYANTAVFRDGKWVESWYCHGDDDEVSCYESKDWPVGGQVLHPIKDVIRELGIEERA